jgi:hypothetical protein
VSLDDGVVEAVQAGSSLQCLKPRSSTWGLFGSRAFAKGRTGVVSNGPAIFGVDCSQTYCGFPAASAAFCKAANPPFDIAEGSVAPNAMPSA